MRKQELETFARHFITQALAGRSVEDSGVELKALWIDAKKAARILAAHANAAGGDAVIWLMGIDEKGKKIDGVEANEMSNWINTLAKQFDGEPPVLTCHANIHYTEGTVVALYFETTGSPYVIKNSKGGSPEFEVPYRRGNETRTANRADLLRILLPKLKYPVIELRNSKLNLLINRNQPNANPVPLLDRFDWTFTAELYFTPRTKDPIVIPHKDCFLRFNIDDLLNQFYKLPFVFKPIGKSLTIRHSASEIIIDGPGSVGLEAIKGCSHFDSRLKIAVPRGLANIGVEIKPVYTEKKIMVRTVLGCSNKLPGTIAKILLNETNVWEYPVIYV